MRKFLPEMQNNYGLFRNEHDVIFLVASGAAFVNFSTEHSSFSWQL